MKRQVEGYLFLNLEWRLAVQEFIDFYSGEEGNWVAKFEDNQLMLNIYDQNDNQAESLRFSPVGSYDEINEQWLWAWGNKHFSVLSSRRSSTIKKYGEKYKIGELTESVQHVDEEHAEVYPVISAAVYGGSKPTIWLPSENNHKLCILIEDDLTLPEVTKETFVQIIKTVSSFTDDFIDLQKSLNDYCNLRNLKHTIHQSISEVTFSDGSSITVQFNDSHGTITEVTDSILQLA